MEISSGCLTGQIVKPKIYIPKDKNKTQFIVFRQINLENQNEIVEWILFIFSGGGRMLFQGKKKTNFVQFLRCCTLG